LRLGDDAGHRATAAAVAIGRIVPDRNLDFLRRYLIAAAPRVPLTGPRDVSRYLVVGSTTGRQRPGHKNQTSSDVSAAAAAVAVIVVVVDTINVCRCSASRVGRQSSQPADAAASSAPSLCFPGNN